MHIGLIAIIFIASAEGRVGNVDASIMLAQSRSILEGSLSIPVEGTTPIGINGLHYSQYGIFTSILWIPFVLLGRLIKLIGAPLSQDGCEEFAVSFAAPMLMTAILILLADIWRSLGAERKSIIRTLWTISLGTMIWTYAKLPSSDTPMAFGILMALREWVVRRARNAEIVAGLWLGLALITRKQAATIVPVILILWIWWQAKEAKSDRFRLVIASSMRFAASLIPAILILLWYNWARFGSPFIERYPTSEIPPFSIKTWSRTLLAFWTSDLAGLLWYSTPLVFGMIVGFRRFVEKAPFIFFSSMALLITQWAFLSTLPYWNGGTTGPRYLLFAVGLMSIPLALLPVHLPKPTLVGLALSFLVGLAVTVPCVLIDPLPVNLRAEVRQGPESILAIRTDETLIVLGFKTRPKSHEAWPELIHRPFQVPNLWHVQITRELKDRRK